MLVQDLLLLGDVKTGSSSTRLQEKEKKIRPTGRSIRDLSNPDDLLLTSGSLTSHTFGLTAC